jgi:hypothetical protein
MAVNIKITVFRGVTSCILADRFGRTCCLLLKMEATGLYPCTQIHGIRPQKTVILLYCSVLCFCDDLSYRSRGTCCYFVICVVVELRSHFIRHLISCPTTGVVTLRKRQSLAFILLPKFHYRDYKTSPLVPIRSQSTPLFQLL